MSERPRSVREPYDLWHPPELSTIHYSFFQGHVRRHLESKVYPDVPPPLVDCSACLDMEVGELVYIVEAYGEHAGTIRFQSRKVKLTPTQELRKLNSLWQLGEGLRILLSERERYALATAGAPTDSEGWE